MSFSVELLKAVNKLFPAVEHPFNLQNEGKMSYAQWQYQWGSKTVECFAPRYTPEDIFADKSVLDMGCGASGKSLYYLSIGAKEVVGVDIVPHYKEEAEKFDFIILDPPAFTKSRKTVDSAFKGYKDINFRAMKLLPRGGYFATASCSHFMPDELFVKMLRSAAKDAGVELRQIEARQQSPDHPILWNVPETDYLKFYIFQVV